MNKIIISVFTLFLAVALQSCGPTPEDAIKYNDNIIDQVNLVVGADNALTEALSKEPTEMKNAEDALVKQLNTSIDVIKKNGGFDGKTEFLDVAVKYLTLYKGVAEGEYKEMVDINCKSSDDLTEDDDAKFNKLNDESAKKLKAASDDFNNFQKTFATKYKFQIEDKSSLFKH